MSAEPAARTATATLPHAGSYDDEEAYNPDTDRIDNRKIKVTCPGCGKSFAALCSPATEVYDSGWRWVGCDHREPYAAFRTRHRCGSEFTFTTHTSQ